jgi:uncharacterized protein involved in exopolysaccharide biosynthesis
MRVYGSSPLYNYVELIFRSKRLFLASVILATVVTVTVALFRVGNYTAQAVIFLTGGEHGASTQAESDSQKGSIQYKLNLLSVLTKDNQFYVDAFKDEGLDKTVTGRQMTDDEFHRFIKDVKAAMTFATGTNDLEISMRWPDPRADRIIKAFYGAFARRVIDEETASAQTQTRALQDALEDYTGRQKAIEAKIIRFKQDSVGKLPPSYEALSAAVENQKNIVKAADQAVMMTKLQLAEVNRQLESTPRTVTDVRLIMTDDPALAPFQEKKDLLQMELAELEEKYNDTHPKVRAVKSAIDRLDKLMAIAEKRRAGLLGKGTPTQRRDIINPQYVRLNNIASEYEVQLQGQQAAQQQALARLSELTTSARTAPLKLEQYLWMTKDLSLITNIRDNLRARLEQSQMSEKQDRELHLAEMKMIVAPTSEQEVLGAKTFVFYAAGPLMGLLVAFAFSLLAETLDHSLRTPVEVEKYLGKPVLAVLPRMDAPRDRRLLTAGEARPTLPSS